MLVRMNFRQAHPEQNQFPINYLIKGWIKEQPSPHALKLDFALTFAHATVFL